MHMCGGARYTYTSWHTCGVLTIIAKVSSLLHQVGPSMELFRLHGRGLYLLSHLTDPLRPWVHSPALGENPQQNPHLDSDRI